VLPVLEAAYISVLFLQRKDGGAFSDFHIVVLVCLCQGGQANDKKGDKAEAEKTQKTL